MGHLWMVKEETLFPSKLITNCIKPNTGSTEDPSARLSNQGLEMDCDGILDAGQQTATAV